jgi:hypothetical protein
MNGHRSIIFIYEMPVLIMIEDMIADLGCDVALLDVNLNGTDSHPVAGITVTVHLIDQSEKPNGPNSTWPTPNGRSPPALRAARLLRA